MQLLIADYETEHVSPLIMVALTYERTNLRTYDKPNHSILYIPLRCFTSKTLHNFAHERLVETIKYFFPKLFIKSDFSRAQTTVSDQPDHLKCSQFRLSCVGEDPGVLVLLLHGHLLVARVSLAHVVESIFTHN